MTAGVYKITNIENGKSYIGISNDIERRFGEHIRGSTINKGGNSLIQSSIRKNGADCFHFEVLEELDNEEDRLEAEPMFIKRYDTMAPNGYNLTPGGETPIALKGEDSPYYKKELVCEDIYNSYSKTRNISKVAEEFGCDQSTVRKRIEEHCSKNNLEIPKLINRTNRQDLNNKSLYESYMELGSHLAVARKFNCSKATVCKRILKYCSDNDIDVPEVVNCTNRNDLDNKTLYESYMELKSMNKVAEEFDCSRQTVKNRIEQYCVDNNLEVPKNEKFSGRNDLDNKQLYLDYLQLENYQRVSAKYNCSDDTVRRRIKEYCLDNGIEVPKFAGPRIRKDLDSALLYKAYLQLGSYLAVAKKFNCNNSTVSRRIKKYKEENGL